MQVGRQGAVFAASFAFKTFKRIDSSGGSETCREFYRRRQGGRVTSCLLGDPVPCAEFVGVPVARGYGRHLQLA